MALKEYARKRNFARTPEPSGSRKDKPSSRRPSALRFVVQLHSASRLHYDFRLELDGVMLSWAVPKGPSLDPNEQRLAVKVEDHPLSYRTFEGVIPPGNYGAGTVMVWDEGTYTARATPDRVLGEASLRQGLAKGHLTVVLEGKKLKGEFALIKLGRGKDAWLLVKKRDAFFSYDAITNEDKSVLTGRTLGEIAKQAVRKGEIWQPKKPAKEGDATVAPQSKEPRKAPKTLKRPMLAPVAKPKLRATLSRKAAALLRSAPDEPFPVRLSLSLPKITTAVPSEKGWIFEPEWEGYRALAMISEHRVDLRSLKRASLRQKFPALAAGLDKFPHDAVLDGIIVPLDAEGNPRAKAVGAKEGKGYAFFVLDLLHLDGKNLRTLPLTTRQEIMASTLSATSTLRINAFQKDKPEFDFSGHPKPPPILARWAQGTYDAPAKASLSLRPGARSSRAISSPSVQPSVAITNADKVYWPDEGYTKGDMIAYYEAVAPLMLPYLLNRPQSLHRHPNGIKGKSFFQKEITGQVPRWMLTSTVAHGSSGKSVTYAVCQNAESLIFLANLGCIEINVWNAALPNLECPDYVVFDLDPGEIAFSHTVAVALEVRKVLRQIGADGFCKTSGGRGLHIYVPIKPHFDHDEVRAFAELLSRHVHTRLPNLTSLERSPASRTRLVYLDFLQNRRGQTMAAPYSVRPRPGATISMPLSWNEVNAKLDPARFTIVTALSQLAKRRDPWQLFFKGPNDFLAAFKRLKKLPFSKA